MRIAPYGTCPSYARATLAPECLAILATALTLRFVLSAASRGTMLSAVQQPQGARWF
jgi:hypothetical protein